MPVTWPGASSSSASRRDPAGGVRPRPGPYLLTKGELRMTGISPDHPISVSFELFPSRNDKGMESDKIEQWLAASLAYTPNPRGAQEPARKIA